MSTIDRAGLEASIGWLEDRHNPEGPNVAILLAAARAHLDTLPRTKMVEVWHVEWAQLVINRWEANRRGQPTREAADHYAKLLLNADTYGNTVLCVRVTGPHQQEVPA